ncbi:MAG: hypothetical protein ACI9DK_000702 [Vicingaceae bacterium]|jgi:hypothetical protein
MTLKFKLQSHSQQNNPLILFSRPTQKVLRNHAWGNITSPNYKGRESKLKTHGINEELLCLFH